MKSLSEKITDEKMYNSISHPLLQHRRTFIKTLIFGSVSVTVGGFITTSQLEAQGSQGKRWLHRMILVDFNKCTGCRTCETVCAQFNHQITVGNETIRSLGNPYLANIRVYPYNPDVDIPIVCVLCKDNPCIEACPVEPDEQGRKALYRDPKLQTIRCDETRCIACESCAEACKTSRVGAILPNKVSRKPERMCTLCDGKPQCVIHCPYNAMSYIEGGFDTVHHAQSPDDIAKDLITRFYRGVYSPQGGEK